MIGDRLFEDFRQRFLLRNWPRTYGWMLAHRVTGCAHFWDSGEKAPRPLAKKRVMQAESKVTYRVLPGPGNWNNKPLASRWMEGNSPIVEGTKLQRISLQASSKW